jgi:hypothetical protein
MNMDLPANPMNVARPNRQITMSPYHGAPDFSSLVNGRNIDSALDRVSIADLLRNGFVYAPHSIFENREAGDLRLRCPARPPSGHGVPLSPSPIVEKARAQPAAGEDLVQTYHRLLCDALSRSCRDMRSPWLLQSGGKDSTSLAIAAADTRPDTTCMTYLGGREENEVESARSVARALGLKHEVLVCDPGRAYDRYLGLIDRMPLLTADFAMLSYVDLATTVNANGGDGVIDGLGSDSYFGMPVSRQHKLLSRLARGLRLPRFVADLPLVDRSFTLCFALATLQMDPVERIFPGSRFTDAEVDELFGSGIARQSRARLETFRPEIRSVSSADELRTMMITIENRQRLRQGAVHHQRARVADGVSVLRPRPARLGLPERSPGADDRSGDPRQQGAGAQAHTYAFRTTALRGAQGQFPVRPSRTGQEPVRRGPRVCRTGAGRIARCGLLAGTQSQTVGQQVLRVEVLPAGNRIAMDCDAR